MRKIALKKLALVENNVLTIEEKRKTIGGFQPQCEIVHCICNGNDIYNHCSVGCPGECWMELPPPECIMGDWCY